jgi:hypothetical protein
MCGSGLKGSDRGAEGYLEEERLKRNFVGVASAYPRPEGAQYAKNCEKSFTPSCVFGGVPLLFLVYALSQVPLPAILNRKESRSYARSSRARRT